MYLVLFGRVTAEFLFERIYLILGAARRYWTAIGNNSNDMGAKNEPSGRLKFSMTIGGYEISNGQLPWLAARVQAYPDAFKPGTSSFITCRRISSTQTQYDSIYAISRLMLEFSKAHPEPRRIFLRWKP